MDSYRAIPSVSNGIIEKVFIKQDTFVYEWEPLFLVKTPNGSLMKVEVGVSGIVSKIFVRSGDRVITDLTLAVIEEDQLPVGCD